MPSQPPPQRKVTRLAALGLALLAGCAHEHRARQGPTGLSAHKPLLLVLPPVSLAGGPVPLKAVRAAVEGALRARGLPLVPDGEAEAFFATHRVRYTGGVEREEASAALHELGATAVVVTTVVDYQTGEVPRLTLVQRAVQTGDEPRLLWIDGTSRAGDDSPGLLDLGLVTDVRALQAEGLVALAASLDASLSGSAPLAGACPLERRVAPELSFRSSALVAGKRLSMAVLPFVNHTDRRGAGEAAALSFARQLATLDGLEVVEPGLVREDLLSFRLVTEGGVTLDRARLIQELVNADLLLTGTVHTFVEGSGTSAPRVEVTIEVSDRRDSELVWRSDSEGRGDRGVFFFEVGRVATAADVTCRLAQAVAARFLTLPAKTLPPGRSPAAPDKRAPKPARDSSN